jgi:hypothetical protein
MAEDSGQTVLPVLKSYILPLVPGLDERLKYGIRILDVGRFDQQAQRGDAEVRAAQASRRTP